MSALSMPVQQPGRYRSERISYPDGCSRSSQRAQRVDSRLWQQWAEAYGELRDAEQKGLEAYNKARTKGSKSTDDDAAKQIGQIEPIVNDDIGRALTFYKR